jgi:flagellar biosynthesis chaperone FliJ
MALTYPLEQLLSIKKNRLDQAIKILDEKKLLLQKAQEQLKAVTQQRDQVRAHKVAKLQQLRETLDEGASTDKIQQMKAYLKLVDGQLAEKEKKVQEQQKQVTLAQKQVDLAAEEVRQKRIDLEKLTLHKEEWSKEVRTWIERKEEVEHDEQGIISHMRKKKDEQR